jgi:hypothetical protein
MILAYKYSVWILSVWVYYRDGGGGDDDDDYMQREVVWVALGKLIDRVVLLGDKEFKDNFKIILMAMNLNSRPPGIVKEDCMLVQTVCVKFSRWQMK